MGSWNEHVFPHSDLIELDPRLYVVHGSLGKSPLPRTMAVYRLDDGLLIHSAIALNDAGTSALEALGTPRILVVPNRFHRADAAVWKERYPELTVVCPGGVTEAASKVVPIDAEAKATLEPLGVTCHGSPDFEYTYELPLTDGVALVCADSLFNIREHLPGFAGLMARYVTRSTGFFGTTGLGKLFMGKKGKESTRAWLLEQAERTDLRHYVPGHGDVVSEDVAARLREAAERL